MGGDGAVRPDGSGRSSAAPDGGWARSAVRALISAAAGIMAAGFLDVQAGVLVAGLTAFSYVLLDAAGRRTPPGAGGLRWALRTLRGTGYRLVPDGAARYVAVGPGGVFLLVATRRPAAPHGRRGWRVGGMPADRIAERLATQAVRLDRVLAAEEGAAHGRGNGGAADTPATTAVVLVTGRRPGAVVEFEPGRVLLARPRPAVRHILARDSVLSAGRIERIAGRIERHLHAD